MTIEICPRCQVRFSVSPQTTDFIHECSSQSEVLDNEDVFVVGDWEDYTGSGEVQNVLMQGKGNKLFGTRAGIEGEKLDDLTSRGNSADTYRTRKHLEFIKLKGGQKDGNKT